MHYRFKVVTGEGDSAEVAFTQWREEQTEADKILEINKLRAANPGRRNQYREKSGGARKRRGCAVNTQDIDPDTLRWVFIKVWACFFIIGALWACVLSAYLRWLDSEPLKRDKPHVQ
jgi:hypothetical protein